MRGNYSHPMRSVTCTFHFPASIIHHACLVIPISSFLPSLCFQKRFYLLVYKIVCLASLLLFPSPFCFMCYRNRSCATRLNFSDAESSLGTSQPACSQLSSLMEDSVGGRGSLLGHSQVNIITLSLLHVYTYVHVRVCIYMYICKIDALVFKGTATGTISLSTISLRKWYVNNALMLNL